MITALLIVFSSSLPVIASNPEDALSVHSNESVYAVMKFDDASGFLKWLMSSENVDVFMPLVLSSKDSNEIIGVIETVRSFAQNTPLKSIAVLVGVDKAFEKTKTPFVQAAFTVSPDVLPSFRKIAEGSAEPSDFAKLVLGAGNPFVSIAETTIKVEREDGVYKINNEVFLKAQEDLIILGNSPDELKSASDALDNSDSRLFSNVKRKLDKKDFIFMHCDYRTLDELDTDHSFDDADAVNVLFDKPLNAEAAFESLPEKFVISFASNLKEAFKDEYRAQMEENEKETFPVNGGNIELSDFGGKDFPLAAFGGYMKLSAIKDVKDTKELWNWSVRQLRARFGITEEEFADLFDGSFSISLNDNVMFQTFKIPAVYMLFTGRHGATAGKVFAKLEKSPHFQKISDGLLQVDSSLSPIPCLIHDMGETLGICFAEPSNVSGNPQIKPALQELLNEPSILSIWLDFAGIQSWINDEENGVMMILGPLATIGGMGKEFQAFRDVMSADLSVPSMSLRAASVEEFHLEFANKPIKPEDGLFAKLISIYKQFSK